MWVMTSFIAGSPSEPAIGASIAEPPKQSLNFPFG